MKKFLPGGRSRTVLSFLGVCLLGGAALTYSDSVATHASSLSTGEGEKSFTSSVVSSLYSLLGKQSEPRQDSETNFVEKMIPSEGQVRMDLNLGRLNGVRSSRASALEFKINPDAFFSILVSNGEFRGSLPSTMELDPANTPMLPSSLKASHGQLVVESRPWGEHFDFVVRDGQTGFVFFNIDGASFEYEHAGRLLTLKGSRLLISQEFANELGRPGDVGVVIGEISISATMRTIESTVVVNGETVESSLPPTEGNAGTVPGPDVVVGDVTGLSQAQSSQVGTQVGLQLGTDSCNYGTVNLNWFQNPANDHPVIPQNLYRMSGGPSNNDRFEQIGQSSLKHAFTALTNNICNLGCNGTGGSQLGSGCSDPYSAGLNGSQSGLGSRAWVNPFTGAYPRNDSATPNNTHSGHSHNATSHRILTEVADLNTSLNPGATYFAEGQYVTPHEYAWCQSNPGQCNMNNNVSYRQYSVSGTGSPFSFGAVGSTQRQKSAIVAWTGASISEIKPDAANEGIGALGYKVTNPSPGVYHYEYAIYNQNMDRAIQSLSIPIGLGVTVSNYNFHAPPQHPGWNGDGTVGNAGFSNTPWTMTEGGLGMQFATETFATNPNANAIRWGTLYNISFDSNRPPMTTIGTIGFFKTGGPINVFIAAPSHANPTCSRLPTAQRC